MNRIRIFIYHHPSLLLYVGSKIHVLASGKMSLLCCKHLWYSPDVGVIFCLLEVSLEKGMEKGGEGKGCSVS